MVKSNAEIKCGSECFHINWMNECLLISCLPGKALRTLVKSRDMPTDSIGVLKLDELSIKRCATKQVI